MPGPPVRPLQASGIDTVHRVSADAFQDPDRCVEAGHELRAGLGGAFLGGDLGPFVPYLPGGAYL